MQNIFLKYEYICFSQMDDGEPNNVGQVHAYEHPIDSIQDDGHACDDFNDAVRIHLEYRIKY